MQFTPLFFSKKDECVVGESNGGVSGSMPIGPYMWTYHHFTASDLSAYNTASLYEFNISQGVTTDAMILSIGGGGGGALAGGAGGAGGYSLKTGVTLAKRLTPYSVLVGHAGDGGYSFGSNYYWNGNDGQDSKFFIYDVIGTDGEGGYGYPTIEYAGKSGIGFGGITYSGGTGSSYQGAGGGGVTQTGSNGGTQYVRDGYGGNGISFYNFIPSVDTIFVGTNTGPMPFAIGGGGFGFGSYSSADKTVEDRKYGEFFGGGGGYGPFPDGGRNGRNATGGGGEGTQEFVGFEPETQYAAGNGGHGSVTVTFPSTTCVIYNPGNYVDSNLVAYWDINNRDTIFNPFQQHITDLTSGIELEHKTLYNITGSILRDVAPYYFNNNNSGNKAITFSETGALELCSWDQGRNGIKLYSEYFSGSILHDFSSSQEISVEMWFKPNDTYNSHDWVTVSGSTDNRLILQTERGETFNPRTDLKLLFDGQIVTQSYTPNEWIHVVATQDNLNNLNLSVNGSTSSVALSNNLTDDLISSSLVIGFKDDATPYGAYGPEPTVGSFGIVRMYDKALDTNEIYQNFVASHGRFYGYPYPSQSFDYVVPTLETGSVYVTSSQVPTNFDWDIQGLTQYIWTRGFLTSSLNNLFQINDSGSDSVSIVANLDTGSFGEYKTDGFLSETKPIPTYDETLWHQHLVTWDFDNKEFYYYIDGQLTSSASIEAVPDTINNPFYTVGQEGSSIRVGEYGLRNYELSQEGIISLYDSQKGRYASDNNTPTKQPVSGSIPVSSSLFSLIDIGFTASYNGTGEVLYDVSENFHNATIETVNGFTYEPAGPGRPDDGYFVVTDSAESTSIDWNTTPFTGSEEFTLLVSWYGQNITYENGLAPLFSDINGNFGLYAGDSSYTSSVVFKAGGVEKTLVPNSGNNGPSVGWHITQVGYNTNTKELSWYCDGVYGSEILSSQCLDTTCDQWLIERCRTSAGDGCWFSYVDCEGITQRVNKPYSSGTDNTYVCVDPCQDPAIFDTTGSFDRSINNENCGTFGPVSPSNFRPILFQEEGNGKIGNATEFQVAALYTKVLTEQEMEDNYNSLYNRY